MFLFEDLKMWFSTPRDSTRLPRELFDIGSEAALPTAEMGDHDPTHQPQEDWDLLEIVGNDSDASEESASDTSGSGDSEHAEGDEDVNVDQEDVREGTARTASDDGVEASGKVSEPAEGSDSEGSDSDESQHNEDSITDAGTTSAVSADGGSMTAHGGMAHALYNSVASNRREYQNAFALSVFTLVCSLFGAARASG